MPQRTYVAITMPMRELAATIAAALLNLTQGASLSEDDVHALRAAARGLLQTMQERGLIQGEDAQDDARRSGDVSGDAHSE